jgi:hypothetical protein
MSRCMEYNKIPATDVIEAMRQDYLKMEEGEEKEKLLSHIFVCHKKLNEIFYKQFGGLNNATEQR